MATSFGERMVRAAKLDRAVYEELEKDRAATGQAAAVVVLVAVATGIGLGAGLRGLAVGLVAGLVAWALWAALIYWVGARMLPEPQTRADWGELARTRAARARCASSASSRCWATSSSSSPASGCWWPP
jgi:hypothetical protein